MARNIFPGWCLPKSHMSLDTFLLPLYLAKSWHAYATAAAISKYFQRLSNPHKYSHSTKFSKHSAQCSITSKRGITVSPASRVARHAWHFAEMVCLSVKQCNHHSPDKQTDRDRDSERQWVREWEWVDVVVYILKWLAGHSTSNCCTWHMSTSQLISRHSLYTMFVLMLVWFFTSLSSIVSSSTLASNWLMFISCRDLASST